MKKTNQKFPPTIKIGILIFDDFEPIDVWGFIQAFSISRFIATDYATTHPVPFHISLIANSNSPKGNAKDPYLVKSYNGPRVVADMYRDQALKANFDVLMIPGGQGVRPILKSVDKFANPNANQPSGELKELIAWIKQMDKKVKIMSSVCTGAAILAYSGLLDGKAATSNHHAFGWVTSFGPNVLWDNVSRWVDAGKYVSSAGVSAGTDMAFHLVSRLAGRAVAETAVSNAEYDWHRNPQLPIHYPQQAEVPSAPPGT
jgi:putative intracellular protease/amidase